MSRQNSVNSFDGGINFDVNPLTTPANILTDCLNGTLLTFNGDELILQNDAGNTKIQVPENSKLVDGGPTEYVELTPKFYPIGMKEFGGVLYIISAKTEGEEAVKEFHHLKLYDVGDIVYRHPTYLNEEEKNLRTRLYYKATESSMGIFTAEFWTKIGNYSDFINEISTVQIGSYPSPEASSVEPIESEITIGTVDITAIAQEDLYKNTTINSAFFKVGSYITFTSPFAEHDSANLLTLSRSDYKAIYNVKLSHVLTNGIIDLTKDIWQKFDAFLVANPTITAEHWYTEPTFEYYCPHQFKGKLAIYIEPEPLKEYGIQAYPTLEMNVGAASDVFYTCTCVARYVSDSEIQVTGATITYFELIDGIEYVMRETAGVLLGGNYSFTSFLPKWDNTNTNTKTIYFRVKPILNTPYAGIDQAALGSIYNNNCVLEGNVVVDISSTLILVATDAFTCLVIDDGEEDYFKNYVTVMGTDGDLRTPFGDVTTVHNIFIKEGLASTYYPAGAIILGTYTEVAGTINVVVTSGTIISSNLLELLTYDLVHGMSVECSEKERTLIFNAPTLTSGEITYTNVEDNTDTYSSYITPDDTESKVFLPSGTWDVECITDSFNGSVRKLATGTITTSNTQSVFNFCWVEGPKVICLDYAEPVAGTLQITTNINHVSQHNLTSLDIPSISFSIITNMLHDENTFSTALDPANVNMLNTAVMAQTQDVYTAGGSTALGAYDIGAVTPVETIIATPTEGSIVSVSEISANFDNNPSDFVSTTTAMVRSGVSPAMLDFDDLEEHRPLLYKDALNNYYARYVLILHTIPNS